jgi:hypothetical protein
MEIKLCDLQPNPFRRMDRYPIDRHKVEALKESIKQTGFWDNVLARPHPSEKDKYQLAYGHHRIIAVQETGQPTVDIPVRPLEDASMIKIMGDENLLQWGNSPTILYETVLVAKQYLDGAFSQYSSWEDFKKHAGVLPRMLWDCDNNPEYFIRAKNQGVGRRIIQSFLGKNWSEDYIRHALSILKDEEIDRTALEMLGTTAEAQEFRKVMKDKGVPVDSQFEIAEKVSKIRQDRKPTPGSGSGGSNWRRHVREDIKQVAPAFFGDEDPVEYELKEKLRICKEKIIAAKVAATDLNFTFHKHSVEQVNDYMEQFDMFNEIASLLDVLQPLLIKFGWKFNKITPTTHQIQENLQ